MAPAASARIAVQLCYADAQGVLLRDLSVDLGATIGEAIVQSGVVAERGLGELTSLVVGIYGKKKTLETVLRERDRIELYRPLLADPKESRRRRAEKKDPAP